MTMRPETRSLSRWLLAAAVCGALLAQMALPALHALETVAPRDALAWQVASVGAPTVARAAQRAAAHDPATCPVCQSLLRTSPIASSLVPCGAACAERVPLPAAAPARDDFVVAQTGHPPRAPPTRAPHLA